MKEQSRYQLGLLSSESLSGAGEPTLGVTPSDSCQADAGCRQEFSVPLYEECLRPLECHHVTAAVLPRAHDPRGPGWRGSVIYNLAPEVTDIISTVSYRLHRSALGTRRQGSLRVTLEAGCPTSQPNLLAFPVAVVVIWKGFWMFWCNLVRYP